MKKTCLRALPFLLTLLPLLFARPGLAQSPERLGLHVTRAELSEWRSRAQNGPYESTGDVSPGSPGDWNRITQNKNQFMQNPSAYRWTDAPTGGCVEIGHDSAPPMTNNTGDLADAAFYALVMQDMEVANAVKQELVAQFSEPITDFSNTSYWCPGHVRDLSPSFWVANWLSSHYFAKDYLDVLDDNLFSSQENNLIEGRFLSAAQYLMGDVDTSLDDNFVTRTGNPEEYTPSRGPGDTQSGYYNGPGIHTIALYYNNRRATSARLTALVAVKQDNANLQNRVKRFFKEFVAFSFYPQGFMGEFERWESSSPDRGWTYAWQALGPLTTIADVFARNGDTSLYDYTTTAGVHGTQGAPAETDGKSLGWMLRSMMKYLNGSYARYGTDSGGNLDFTHRINGEMASGQRSQHHIEVGAANLYYQNSLIRQGYTRDGPGIEGYAGKPSESIAGFSPWKGDWGIFPGVLFMFGQLEGEIHPYPGGTPNPDPDPDPDPNPDPDNENLANGTTHIGDSGNFHSQSPVSGFWDGNVSGDPQNSPGNSGTRSFWVEYDLGQVSALSEARLYGDTEGSWTSDRYTVKVKANAGDAYTTVVDAKNASGNQWFAASLDGVEARFVRVDVTGDPATGSTQAREFEVYGAPDGGGDPPPGEGNWATRDIGNVATEGDSDSASDGFVVEGGGRDIWQTQDAFRFTHQQLTGDGTVTARVTEQTDTDTWAKAGVMIRENLSPDARHAMTVVTPGHGTAFQRRTRPGSGSDHTPSSVDGSWVRVVRSGDTVIGYTSRDGSDWSEIGRVTLSMPETVYVGLAVTSHATGQLSTATFEDVVVEKGNAPITNASTASTEHVEEAASPQTFGLEQNYPNPFRSTTHISYHLPEAADVTVALYDVLGRRVATLEEGWKEPGSHTIAFDASTLRSGTYFYRIQAGAFTETKQMTVVK